MIPSYSTILYCNVLQLKAIVEAAGHRPYSGLNEIQHGCEYEERDRALYSIHRCVV